MPHPDGEPLPRGRANAAGPEWTRLQRSGYGLDGGDTVAGARATCALYAATTALLRRDLDPDDCAVAERALQVLD